MAAAEGDLDRAIELAKQAAGDSPAPSFFGAGGNRPQNSEATRWLERLIAQRDAHPQPSVGRRHEASEEVFEPPIRVASKLPRKSRETAPTVEPARNEAVSETSQSTLGVETALARRSAEASATDPQSTNSSETALWSEELPEATQPVEAVAHEPVKFARRTIDASAGWVDADALDRAATTPEARPPVAETQLATEQIPDTSTAIELEEATPEFSIGEVPLQAEVSEMPIADGQPGPAEPAADIERVEPATEVQASPESEEKPDRPASKETPAVSERGPLRLRQHISKMPEMDLDAIAVGMDEVIEEESQSPAGVTERAPLRFRKNPVQTADLTVPPPAESVPQPRPADSEPSTRRTLRLRPQIQQVAGEINGVAEDHSSTSQRPAEADMPPRNEPIKSLPHTFAEIPSESIKVVADETMADAPVQRFPVQRVLRLRERIKEATALNPGGQLDEAHREGKTAEPPSSEQTPGQHPAVERDVNQSLKQEPTQSATRPAVKLRERTRLKLDDPTANSSSTPVPRPSTKNRQPVVARSESNLWKSVDSSKPDASSPVFEYERNDRQETAAAQPILPPPITQAGFESADPKSTDLQKTALSDNGAGAQAKSDFDLAPPPPVTRESHPWHEDGSHEKGPWTSDAAVRKSSFALIDQLADAFKIPAKTLVSLIMGSGAVLLVGGLVAMRAAIRRRHSA